jgi:hypothetical protein
VAAKRLRKALRGAYVPIWLRVPPYVLELVDELRPRLDGATRAAVLRVALVEGLRALEQAHPAKRKRRRPGRPLTPDELAQAEDCQVLDVLTLAPATVGTIADALLPYESTGTPDGASIRIDWADMPAPERRARIRRVLARLRDAGLARVLPGTRTWVPSRRAAVRAKRG